MGGFLLGERTIGNQEGSRIEKGGGGGGFMGLDGKGVR